MRRFLFEAISSVGYEGTKDGLRGESCRGQVNFVSRRFLGVFVANTVVFWRTHGTDGSQVSRGRCQTPSSFVMMDELFLCG